MGATTKGLSGAEHEAKHEWLDDFVVRNATEMLRRGLRQGRKAVWSELERNTIAAARIIAGDCAWNQLSARDSADNPNNSFNDAQLDFARAFARWSREPEWLGIAEAAGVAPQSLVFQYCLVEYALALIKRGLDNGANANWTVDECQAVADARRVIEEDTQNRLNSGYEWGDAEFFVLKKMVQPPTPSNWIPMAEAIGVGPASDKFNKWLADEARLYIAEDEFE